MSASAARQPRDSRRVRAKLLSLLSCPACERGDSTLAPASDGLSCVRCRTKFPRCQLGRVTLPWLFQNPDCTLTEWRARFNGFLQTNLSEQFRLSRRLDDESLTPSTRERLSRSLRAKEGQRVQVLEVLEPLGLTEAHFSEALRSLHSKLPKTQGLVGYYNNILRDWAWNNGENEEQLQAMDAVLEADPRAGLGRMLTLGAGACRLSYDLHRARAPDRSVVVDFNPLLLMSGCRVIGGETLRLYEFPIAPLDDRSYGVLQECRAPEPFDQREHRFEFVFADAMNPPFKASSFDTVLTPWLIDVMPQDLRLFMPRVNRLLSRGGVWLNTGSLAFSHRDEAWNYSERELLELLAANGFEILAHGRRKIRYMHSPLSAHGRVESVFSFAARKVKQAAPVPHYDYLPKWILETNKPIPGQFEFALSSSSHLLHAQVLAAIDGKRNIEDIGALVAKEYGLPQHEATSAVHRILIELYEQR